MRAHARYREAEDTVEYTAVDGTSVVASPSFLEVDTVAACTVMLTRDDPSVAVRKEDVEAAVLGSLDNELVKIHTIRKYNNDHRVICVRFESADSADALMKKKTLLVNDAMCTVSRYGETLVRVQLSHVPMTATIDEVIDVVKHIGNVKRITRPLIHGFEDHLVHIALVVNDAVDLSEEQKITTRSAKFGGRRTYVQYRCLDEIAFCPVCKVVGHKNGPRCPLAGRCLICNEKGHMKRNCPNQHAQSGKVGGFMPPGAEKLPPVREKPRAPLPPCGDPDNMTSTGLPPLDDSTWGASNPCISAIETRRSRSPLDRQQSSSTRSVVSAERQARIDATIRGGKMRTQAFKQSVKERKLKEKEYKTSANCFSAPRVTSEVDIPQVDGPIDSAAATSCEIVEEEPEAPSEDTTDNEKEQLDVPDDLGDIDEEVVVNIRHYFELPVEILLMQSPVKTVKLQAKILTGQDMPTLMKIIKMCITFAIAAL